MNIKLVFKRFFSTVILIGFIASCDGVNNSPSSGSGSDNIKRPADPPAYKTIPDQGILIPHGEQVPVFYFKFDQGYLVLSTDESFNGDNVVMQSSGGGEYYGGGYELKFKKRQQTDDELIMDLGEENKGYYESGYYKGYEQREGETDEQYIYRIGKVEFNKKAKDKDSWNGDKTNPKPSDFWYDNLYEGAAIIASDGIFHFDMVATEQ